MMQETLAFPSGSIRCQRGDYIMERIAEGRVRVYRVEELVRLSRLVPFGEDALIDEQAVLDSERPAFVDEIHLLVTPFERDFPALLDSRHAIVNGDLGSQSEWRCLDIRRFPMTTCKVFRPAVPGGG
jgi:hypothetical protein